MRVRIIGIGGVGEATAHLLVSRGIARSLVLANRNLDVAEAVRMDLEQSRSWGAPLSQAAALPWHQGLFDGCDVVILTAGPRLRGNETRDAKAAETARILRGRGEKSIVAALSNHVKRGTDAAILLVVTNPVEATVTWLAEATGWPKKRIVGLGTTVETARFSRFLADQLGVDPTSVWTEIVGEHGDRIALRDERAFRLRVRQLHGRDVDLETLLTRTRFAAREIRMVSEAVGERVATGVLADLERDFGPDFLECAPKEVLRNRLAASLAPPATRFAIAAAALEVVESVARDRGRVLTVSSFTGLEGLPDVALAVPFVVGRGGALACALDSANDFLKETAGSIAAQVEAMNRAAA